VDHVYLRLARSPISPFEALASCSPIVVAAFDKVEDRSPANAFLLLCEPSVD